MKKNENLNAAVDDLVFNQLDRIVEAAMKASKEWGTDAIPITILEATLNLANIKKKSGNKKLNVFYSQYNDVLKQIGNTCKETSKNLGTRSVSVDYLNKVMDTVKSNFIKGIAQNN